ncbi:unnamed protein product [Caenorhabditis bovis]|uniref:Gustatory receptor n=1 Tax=Caenorhabditis bovis TaxID=2654633 RepID=A0A8S1EXE5_9PELO|nr:unnamed protein product [Caenorhabditis bovis]
MKTSGSVISIAKNEYENNPFLHVEKIISFLRLDFSEGRRLKLNIIINAFFICTSMYYLGFMAKTMFFKSSFYILDMSMQLLSMIWNFEAILSFIFLMYWQKNGQLAGLKEKLAGCQNYKGVQEKTSKFQNNAGIFLALYVAVLIFNCTYYLKFYFEETHSIWALKISTMFYFRRLRFLTSIITTYMYFVWLTAIYVFVTFTNVVCLEVKQLNRDIQKINGDSEKVKSELLEKLELFQKLSKVIHDLDDIFKNLTSITDFLICTPFIAFCVCSFCSVTVAPARLHDEIRATKSAVFGNHAIWFPYDGEVHGLAHVFASHVDQNSLGITIWGFAVVSRPLILATRSATGMMLSLLSEFSPSRDE